MRERRLAKTASSVRAKDGAPSEATMQQPRHNLALGTILIRRGTALPPEPNFETCNFCGNWDVVSDSDRVDARLRASGWNLFFIASPLRSFSVGSSDGGLRKAVRRLVRLVEPLSLNCLQITHIANRRLLGIPYRVVFAHPCHIQKSCFLPNAETRRNSIAQSDIDSKTMRLPNSIRATPAHATGGH